MPQMSLAYAVARIGAHAGGLLTETRMERLLSAPTGEEALRVLSEMGMEVTPGMRVTDITQQRVEQAATLVRRVTPDPRATDGFLLRYDALNLKILFKSRCLGQTVQRLSPCGVFPSETLKHCVMDHTYKRLPLTLATGLDALEKMLALKTDALVIDTAVDRAITAYTMERIQGVKVPAIKTYFLERLDFQNAITLLRVKAMGRDASFAKTLLLQGGQVPVEAWLSAFEKPETLAKLLSPYGRKAQQAALAAALDSQKLPALEKVMDDAGLAAFAPYRRSALRIEPVIGYLLGAQREAQAVQLILSAKQNGFADDAVTERLRALYA